MIPQPSSSESARFARPVARLTIDALTSGAHEEVVDAIEAFPADVIILRYPASSIDLYRHLMSLRSHQPLFADCLLYWECDLKSLSAHAEIAADLHTREVAAPAVGDLVRPVFAQYSNHYAANPLFDPAAALEGYVEWVTRLVDNGSATCLAVDDIDVSCVGFAVIDFSAEIPDIRLAGISPNHRGRGRYRDLVAATMGVTADAGHDRLAISTQAHNTTVMKTWAALGWTPTKAVTTVHLVKRGLI